MNHPIASAIVLVLGAALSLPASAAAAAATGTAGATPLGDFMGHLRSVKAVVGGKPGTFLLDTGGGITFVSPEFAKDIGCEPWGSITGFRLTGERLDLPRCDGVSVVLPGRKASAPATIGVLDLKPFLPQGAPAIDGSLALDVLDGQSFTLDLRAGTLEFETPESLAQEVSGAIEIPIRVTRHGSSGHALAVYARSKTAKGSLWLEIDSGGGAPVLLRDKVAAEAGADPAVSKPQPYKLTLAGKDTAVTLPTRAIVRDMIHDGVVGMPVLVHWRITFDLAADRMWLAPAKP